MCASILNLVPRSTPSRDGGLCVVPPLDRWVCRRFILRFDARAPSSQVLLPSSPPKFSPHMLTTLLLRSFSVIHFLSLHPPPRIAPSAASSRWTITVRGSKTVSGSSTTSISSCKVPTRGVTRRAFLPTPPLLHAPRVTHPAFARQCMLSPTCVKRAVSQGQHSSASPRRLAPGAAPGVPPDASPVLHDPGHPPGALSRGIIHRGHH